MTETVHCSACSKDDRLSFSSSTNARMVGHQLCFECLHWTDLVNEAGSPNSVRADGEHYFICRDDVPQRARGFGGQRFKITFTNGREVTTCNLWHQGEIPPHFRSKLPDNATILEIGG